MPAQKEAAPGLHRCTPPDVLVRDHDRWQVSWLAGPCVAPPSRLPSGVIGARLTAHSCGGSHGIGPASSKGDGLTVFPFDPRREPSTMMMPGRTAAGQGARCRSGALATSP